MITRTIRSLVVVVRAIADAGACVSRVTARAVSRQVVSASGYLIDDLRLARRVGDEIADPVDRVGEVLAHLRLHLLVALEVGERERPAAPRRELQPLGAGVAGEVVVARERRADAAVLAAIEEAHRIGRVVGRMA